MMASGRFPAVLNQLPIWLIAIVLALSCWGLVNTYQTNIAVTPDQTLNRGINYYEAQTANTTLNDIVSLPRESWRAQQQDQHVLPKTTTAYWLQVQLSGLDDLHNWLLEINHSQLDYLSVFFIADNNVLGSYHTGDQMPFRSRGIAHEQFLFPVPVMDNRQISLFIKIQNRAPTTVPMYLWKQQHYLVANGEHSVAMGLFFGFMAAMSISNFFFFVSTRSMNFLLYTGYVLSLALLLFSMNGMGYKYFWINNTWMQNHSIGIFANASMLLALLFIRQLLNLREYHQLIDKSLLGLAGVYAIFLVGSVITTSYLATQVFLLAVILSVIYIFMAGIKLWHSGLKVSRIYALAWATILVTALIGALHSLNLYQTDIELRYLLMTGGFVETILLALLLAQNYSEQSKALLQAQEHALTQEKEAQAAKDEIIEVQQKANDELEYAVQERTLELEITLRELAEKNQALEAMNTEDALTGIRNRRYFDKKYAAEMRLSRRNETELAIAMIDIDYFKKVNDTYGHLAGDECLRHVAQTVKQHLQRPGDEVFRYGGEEFAVLLPQTDGAGAEIVLDKIRAHIADHPVQVGHEVISLTISIGICSMIFDGSVTDNVPLDTADKALYTAKQSGRNRVIYRALASNNENSPS